MKSKVMVNLVGATCLAVLVVVFYATGGVNPASAASSVHWKIACHSPQKGVTGVNIQEFVKVLKEKSDGRFTADVYFSGELLSSKDMLDGLGAGVADMGVTPAYYYTPSMVLTEVSYLPGVWSDRADWNTWAMNKLLKSPVIVSEMERNNLVAIYFEGFNTYPLMSTVPIRTLADFKGKKVRVPSDVGKILQQFGAIPAAIPWGDVYTSLDTGLLHAVQVHHSSIRGNRFDEVTKYYIDNFHIACTPSPWVANKKSFNKLPDDLKKILLSVGEEHMPRYIEWLANDPDMKAKNFARWKKDGIEVIRLSDDDHQKLVDASAPIWDNWVKRAGGEKARKVLNNLLDLIKEAKQKYPDGIKPYYKP